MSYKITIKKNFLKENCGDSAAPTVPDVPVQGLPLAGDVSLPKVLRREGQKETFLNGVVGK